MKKDLCRIKVPVPKGANVEKIESLIKKALNTELTDLLVKDCNRITIVIKHNKQDS